MALDLRSFMESRENRAWIETHRPMSAYVRKARRVLGGAALDVLDVATVETEESEQGKGHFGSFLREAEEIAKEFGKDGLYVENAMSPKLQGFLSREGYENLGRDPAGSACFWKKRENLGVREETSQKKTKPRGVKHG